MSSFYERQKHLFNHLKDAEEQFGFSKNNKASKDQDFGIVDSEIYKKVKLFTKQFRGKESIFKRHDPNKKLFAKGVRPRVVPDYFKNPQKWTYYTLSDVTAEQMSDETNAATAHAILKKLEDEEFDKLDLQSESADDLIFKKPKFCVSATVKTAQVEDKKLIVKNNKIIMPEYFIGKASNKTKSSARNQSTKDKSNDEKESIKLDHLFEDDVD